MDQVEPVKSIPEGIPTFAMGDQQGSSDSEKGDQNSGSTSIGDEKIDETAAEDDYPDGGLRAWLIIVGDICSVFATVGFTNSWGAFQGHYQETILKDSSPSQIAWIGSLQYALIFFPGLITGRLFDLGYFHSIYISSSALLVVATFLTAECKQYWQFLLCQGFAIGIACGCISATTPAVIAHWFKKRRGLAMGIVATGASIGGTVLPIATRQLIPKVGFRWTVRIIGFILLANLTIAACLLKRRLPPKKVSGGLVNIRAFKNIGYSIYCLAGLTGFLGLYTMLTFASVSARKIGISSEFSVYFVALANAGSLFGRYLGGAASDRLGPMNVMIPMTAGAGILTYAWPHARSEASLIVVTVIYGFFVGAYIALSVNPIMSMGDIGDVGRRIGMYFTIMAVGALTGPPISGAILARSDDFTNVGIYAGTCIFLGVFLMSISRYLILGGFSGKI